MKCDDCKAVIKCNPGYKCKAGVRPFMLRSGALGCAYNGRTIDKLMSELENSKKEDV